MTYDTQEVDTIEDARTLAVGRGRCLLMAPETMHQIEDAEAAGAFEGGMTGNADGAPYSTDGSSPNPSSSASDPAPTPEPFDLDGALVISIDGAIEKAEGLVEKIFEAHDVFEAFHRGVVGPIFLVPTRELKKWLDGGAGTDGA